MTKAAPARRLRAIGAPTFEAGRDGRAEADQRRRLAGTAEPFAKWSARATLRSPVAGGEQDKHGDDLEPTQVHERGQRAGGEVAEGLKRTHRSREAEAGTDAA